MIKTIKLLFLVALAVITIMFLVYIALVLGLNQSETNDLVKNVTETLNDDSSDSIPKESREILQDLLPDDLVDTLEEKQEAINLLDQLGAQ